MGIESGIGMVISIDDGTPSAQDISSDITDLTFGTPKAVLDITGIGDSAMRRIIGLGDFVMSLSGKFNDASNKSHAVFKTVPSQAATIFRTIDIALSGQKLTAETLPTDYALTRGADGDFSWNVPFVNQNGAPSWS
ncbi:MAG: hypothetical protein IIC21_11735 [Chloroflexi bacterium]|nr:hypothetical protein [Chloroflexota bacterium]